MGTTLIIHIVAGVSALIAGFIALYSSKGASLHRRSGMAFVIAMVTMSTIGMFMAIARGVMPAINIPAGVLTIYLTLTALTTVRPPFSASRPVHLGLMLAAVAISLVDLTFGFQAVASADGTRFGAPAFPLFLFGVAGALAVVGDVRVLRSGPRRGKARLTRHLWRMCFALLIASLSAGQLTKRLPEYRNQAVLMLPPLVVLVTMLYWLWRVRLRQSLRGMVRRTEPLLEVSSA